MKRAAVALLLGACTSLGPMPATTGISAAPIGRPGVEAQVSEVPGFYASQSARNEADGATFKSLSVLLDLDRWVAKGLLVGGRIFGQSGDRPIEPYVGYRRRVVEAISIGAVAFGSTKRVEKPYATYHGVRLGGEAMADVEVWAANKAFRVHLQGAASITRILASGRYCVDDEGLGVDCQEDTTRNTVIGGKFVGVYPAGTATLALDMGRREGTFNNLRLALLGTAGRMPLVVSGDESDTGTYYQIGVSLTVGFGLGRPAAPQ